MGAVRKHDRDALRLVTTAAEKTDTLAGARVGAAPYATRCVTVTTPRRELEPTGDASTALDRAPETELIDVPATVVCAMCGSAECPGCAEERTKSGIVAVVPWERPGPVLSRLWTTARYTTRSADEFFHSLPDGQIVPAVRFALFAETLAAGSMLACFALAGAAIFPGWAWSLARDAASRALLLRGVTVAVPGLAVLLVAAHALHGLALEMGTDPMGRRPSRGLRFGLYACGWDLVLGPLGFVLVAAAEGLGAALALPRLAVGLPRRSALAYLRSHRLEGDAALPALRASYVAAALATVGCALVLLASIVWLAAA